MSYTATDSRGIDSSRVVLRIEGPLVVGTVSEWQNRLADHLASCATPTIDLAGITVMDAFGLQLLVAARRSVGAHGAALLRNPPPCFDAARQSAGMSSLELLSSQP